MLSLSGRGSRATEKLGEEVSQDFLSPHLLPETLDSWNWPSGFPEIHSRSQVVNTISTCENSVLSKQVFGSSLWELVSHQPLTFSPPLQRPSNWELLRLELQALLHLFTKNVFFSFKIHKFVTELCFLHTEDRHIKSSDFPSGPWFNNKSPDFCLSLALVAWRTLELPSELVSDVTLFETIHFKI